MWVLIAKISWWGGHRSIGGNATYGSMSHVISQTHARGNWGVLYFDGVDIRKKSDNSIVEIPIGTGTNDLHIGDLVFINYDNDAEYDHSAVFWRDINNNESLDVSLDLLLCAGHEPLGGESSGVFRTYLEKYYHLHDKLEFIIRYW